MTLKIRKPTMLYGIAVNDAEYVTQINSKVDGKAVVEWRCPFFDRWYQMIRRCYSKDKRYEKSYSDVTVCDEWLTFSNFKTWMETQDWEGKVLDKDIKIKGSRIYSPQTCLFISNHVNCVLVDTHNDKETGLPKGVTYHASTGKYMCRVRDGDKRNYFGLYEKLEDALRVYKIEKNKVLVSLSEEVPEILNHIYKDI